LIPPQSFVVVTFSYSFFFFFFRGESFLSDRGRSPSLGTHKAPASPPLSLVRLLPHPIKTCLAGILALFVKFFGLSPVFAPEVSDEEPCSFPSPRRQGGIFAPPGVSVPPNRLSAVTPNPFYLPTNCFRLTPPRILPSAAGRPLFSPPVGGKGGNCFFFFSSFLLLFFPYPTPSLPRVPPFLID